MGLGHLNPNLPGFADSLPEVRLCYEHHDGDWKPPGAGARAAGCGQVLDGQESVGQGEIRPFPGAKALSGAPSLGLLSQHWEYGAGLVPFF